MTLGFSYFPRTCPCGGLRLRQPSGRFHYRLRRGCWSPVSQ